MQKETTHRSTGRSEVSTTLTMVETEWSPFIQQKLTRSGAKEKSKTFKIVNILDLTLAHKSMPLIMTRTSSKTKKRRIQMMTSICPETTSKSWNRTTHTPTWWVSNRRLKSNRCRRSSWQLETNHGSLRSHSTKAQLHKQTSVAKTKPVRWQLKRHQRNQNWHHSRKKKKRLRAPIDNRFSKPSNRQHRTRRR